MNRKYLIPRTQIAGFSLLFVLVFLLSSSVLAQHKEYPVGIECVAVSEDGKTITGNYSSKTGIGEYYISTDYGVTWTTKSLKSSIGGSCGTIYSSPDGTNLVFAKGTGKSNGRIYTSNDSGTSWASVAPSGDVNVMASTADGKKLVGTGRRISNEPPSIYTSIDSGLTWTNRGNSRPWRTISSSADGVKLVAIQYGLGQIYTSRDSGRSWAPRDIPRNWFSMQSSADGTTLAALVETNKFDDDGTSLRLANNRMQLYTSADSGVTWKQRKAIGHWTGLIRLSADGTRLVATALENGRHRIYTSSDSGATWTPRGTLMKLENPFRTLIELQNPFKGIGSTKFELLYSLFGGHYDYVSSADGRVLVTSKPRHYPSKWLDKMKVSSWKYVVSSADGTKLVATANEFLVIKHTLFGGGQVYTSKDSGVSWTPHGKKKPGLDGFASSTDGTKLVAYKFNSILTSTDSGSTWTPRMSRTKYFTSVASSADGTKLVAGQKYGRIYTSTDSGVTWTPRDSKRNWRSVASSADGTKLVAGVDEGRIYTSTDSGVTWTPRDSKRIWRSIASSADGTKLIAAAQIILSEEDELRFDEEEDQSMDDDERATLEERIRRKARIYTSTDSGVSWTARENTRAWGQVASSADGSKLVAGVDEGWIYTSADFGVTWTQRAEKGGWISIASSVDGTKLVAVRWDGGIYISVDSGVSWKASNTPDKNVKDWL